MNQSNDDVTDLAGGLIGLTVMEARRIAAERGFRIRDVTRPGWYTNKGDLKRVDITIDDSGRVVTSKPG